MLPVGGQAGGQARSMPWLRSVSSAIVAHCSERYTVTTVPTCGTSLAVGFGCKALDEGALSAMKSAEACVGITNTCCAQQRQWFERSVWSTAVWVSGAIDFRLRL